MSNCCSSCVLIQECDLYLYTPLNKHVKIADHKDVIEWAQDFKLKPLIPCFNLCKKDLGKKETKVKNEAKKMLAAWIYYRWLEVYGLSSITASGLVGYDGEESSNVGLSIWKSQVAVAKSTAEAYTVEFKKLRYCNVQDPCSPNKELLNFEKL